MNAPFKLTAPIAASSQWFVQRLERLHDALEAEASRAPCTTDEDVEYHGQLDAAREAAEALDIALGNLGWLPTFKGSLDGGAA